jgi:hypothetical protein
MIQFAYKYWPCACANALVNQLQCVSERMDLINLIYANRENWLQ